MCVCSGAPAWSGPRGWSALRAAPGTLQMKTGTNWWKLRPPPNCWPRWWRTPRGTDAHAVHTKHARGTDVVLWTVRPSSVYIDKLTVRFCSLSGTEILSWAKVNTTYIFIIIIVCRNGQKASETFQSVLVSRPCCCCLCCLLLVFLSDRVFVSNQPKCRLERKTAKLVSRNDPSEQANGLMC